MSIIRRTMLEALGMQNPHQELDETILDKNAMKAIMMAGGPGSGKSYVLKKLSEVIHPMPKILDSDKIFEAKLKANNLSQKLAPEKTPERDEQMKQRELAMGANLQVIHHMLNGFMPVIFDGTGKSVKKFTAQKETLESLGYDVMLLMVNTSLEVAQERNKKRTRSLTPEEVEKFWNMCQEAFQQYPSIFKFHLSVNNDPGMLNEKELVSYVQKFLDSPVQNPIGQELFANKDKGPIVRQVPKQDVSAFA